MGLFLEILVPAFTQVHYYEFVVRPLAEAYNLAFGWFLSTQVMVGKFVEKEEQYQLTPALSGFEILNDATLIILNWLNIEP